MCRFPFPPTPSFLPLSKRVNLPSPLFLTGVLPCDTATEVVQHIQKSWQRGKEAVDALRAQLSTSQKDALCPLVDGGVNLHKLYGVMHDTCNTANLVAELIIELQQRQKREYLMVKLLKKRLISPTF